MERRRFAGDLAAAGTGLLAPGSVGFRTTREAYVGTAERLNPRVHKKFPAKRLADVSRRVCAESLKVNAKFAAIEWDPEALREKN